MKYPKLWDGATPVGEAYVRAMVKSGAPVGTAYGQEVRADGTLGEVMAKHCGNANDVYRSGTEQTTGDPFLCTWPATAVSLLDKVLPTRSAKLDVGSANYMSAGAFIGDGFVAGVMAEKDGHSPVLMRVPSPGALLDKEAYLRLSLADRKKNSVKLDLIPSELKNQIRRIYVVPMGWKNDTERYVFAVVLEERVPSWSAANLPHLPRVLLYDTGTLSVWDASASSGPRLVLLGGSSAVAALGLNWEPYGTESANSVTFPSFGTGWQQGGVLRGLVSCTAPGKLEMICYFPESNNGAQVQMVGVGSLPYASAHNTLVMDGLDWIWTTGSGSGFYSYWMKQRDARRAATFIATSDDFGQTWRFVAAPALDATSAVTPVPPAMDFGYYTPEPFGDYTAAYSTVTISAPPRQPIFTRAGNPPFPAFSGEDRGTTVRAGYDFFTLIGAGSTTFAIAAKAFYGPTTPVSVPTVFDFRDVLLLSLSRCLAIAAGLAVAPYPLTPSSVVTQGAQIFNQPQLFRRVGSGDFVPLAWPGDNSAHAGMVDAKAPTEWLTYYREHTQINVSWASTGEGRATFFLSAAPSTPGVSADPSVMAIATADGGDTWTTLELTDTAGMWQFCLLVAEKGAPASILYSAWARDKDGALTGKRQLMHLAPDLSTVTKYGAPYTSARGGLINFQKYVHPGFPGVYDGPDQQPKAV